MSGKFSKLSRKNISQDFIQLSISRVPFSFAHAPRSIKSAVFTIPRADMVESMDVLPTCCYQLSLVAMLLGWLHVLFLVHPTTSQLTPTTPKTGKSLKIAGKLSENPLQKPILSEFFVLSRAPDYASVSPKATCFGVSCFRISHAP
jgi:hypothetical protein